MAIVLAVLTFTVGARADHPAPGEVAFVDLGVLPEQPSVRFGQRRVLVYENGPRWTAIVGLGSRILPGEYIVTVGISDDPLISVPFRVAHLGDVGVDQTRRGDAVEPAGTAERQQWPYTERFQPAPPFARPVVGKVLSEYSTASPSVVLGSTDGSSVLSPASGRIVEVSADGPGAERVRIDHGRGVFSVISPVYAFQLDIDTDVYTGTRLGVAGAMAGEGQSGVHWRMTLNGELIDPMVMTRPVGSDQH